MSKLKSTVWLTLGVIAFPLTVQAKEINHPQIKIIGCKIKEPLTGKNTAAFMKITSEKEDTLLKAEAPTLDAKSIEIHDHIHEGDNLKMVPVAKLDIKAGEELELRPGGKHVMFIGLSNVKLIKAGEKIDLTLYFKEAGKQSVTCEVIKPLT